MASLSIEVKETDAELLAQIADAEYRTPEQQAAAFVHATLNQHRAKQNAPDRPASVGARRGPRAASAAA